MKVYVVASEGGMCKIGMTNNTQKRLKGIATGHPYMLRIAFEIDVPDHEARTVESAAHRLLSEHRMTGEWFAVSVERAIEAVSGGKGGIVYPKHSQANSPLGTALEGTVLEPTESYEEEKARLIAQGDIVIEEYIKNNGAPLPSQYAIDELGEQLAIDIMVLCRIGLGREVSF